MVRPVSGGGVTVTRGDMNVRIRRHASRQRLWPTVLMRCRLFLFETPPPNAARAVSVKLADDGFAVTNQPLAVTGGRALTLSARN